MQLIKGGSSYEIHGRRGSTMQIWHSGFHEESVRGGEDYRRTAEYIPMNPVCGHLVERMEDWPYSSASTGLRMDPVAARLRVVTPGAEAPFLKDAGNVGAKAPTP
jgi:hypothetical protein